MEAYEWIEMAEAFAARRKLLRGYLYALIAIAQYTGFIAIELKRLNDNQRDSEKN